MVRVGKRRREGVVERVRKCQYTPLRLPARPPLATACESTPTCHDHAGWLSRYGAQASATRRTAMAVFFGRTTIVSSAADTGSSED